eukprot:scaffold1401_cov330-Pavlova_lutheri.AAC.57
MRLPTIPGRKIKVSDVYLASNFKESRSSKIRSLTLPSFSGEEHAVFEHDFFPSQPSEHRPFELAVPEALRIRVHIYGDNVDPVLFPHSHVHDEVGFVRGEHVCGVESAHEPVQVAFVGLVLLAFLVVPFPRRPALQHVHHVVHPSPIGLWLDLDRFGTRYSVLHGHRVSCSGPCHSDQHDVGHPRFLAREHVFSARLSSHHACVGPGQEHQRSQGAHHGRELRCGPRPARHPHRHDTSSTSLAIQTPSATGAVHGATGAVEERGGVPWEKGRDRETGGDSTEMDRDRDWERDRQGEGEGGRGRESRERERGRVGREREREGEGLSGEIFAGTAARHVAVALPRTWIDTHVRCASSDPTRAMDATCGPREGVDGREDVHCGEDGGNDQGANRACTSTGAVDPRLGSHAALVATIPVPNPPTGSVVHAPIVGSSRDAQEEGGGISFAPFLRSHRTSLDARIHVSSSPPGSVPPDHLSIHAPCEPQGRVAPSPPTSSSPSRSLPSLGLTPS